MSWHGLTLQDDPVAELRVEGRSADGEAATLSIVIHRPVAVPDNNSDCHVCRMQVDGAFHKSWNGVMDIGGEGSWQALQLANQLSRRVVEAEQRRGVEYRWGDGSDETIDIDLLFPS